MVKACLVACILAMAASVLAASQPSSASKRPGKGHHAAAQKKAPRKAMAATVKPSPAPTPTQTVTVSYQKGLLSISADNAELREIMNRVRDSTGAMVEMPPLNERVTVHLGPRPAAEVLAALLDGSHLNYVILGGLADPDKIGMIEVTVEPPQEREPAAESATAKPVDSDATAQARALFIAQTGGDEGVWDNENESQPTAAAVSQNPAPVLPGPAATPASAVPPSEVPVSPVSDE